MQGSTKGPIWLAHNYLTAPAERFWTELRRSEDSIVPDTGAMLVGDEERTSVIGFAV